MFRSHCLNRYIPLEINSQLLMSQAGFVVEPSVGFPESKPKDWFLLSHWGRIVECVDSDCPHSSPVRQMTFESAQCSMPVPFP